MKAVKSIVRNILRKSSVFLARLKLRRLQDLANPPVVNKLLKAIDEGLCNELSSDETAIVDRIEKMRIELNRSSREVLVTDYGAGKPDFTRTDEEMYNGTVATITVSTASLASKPKYLALVLFKLIREFQPEKCIELGTCVGISAAYQAAAQQLNGRGKFFTMEGADSLASISSENLRGLGLGNATVISGRFQDNLEKLLNENREIDYAFIDGHHDEEATILYFEQIRPYLSKNAMLVFDDIAWGSGMRRAWGRIKKREECRVTLSLRTMGICIFGEDINEKLDFDIPLL
jgi:predicted O-methyltransferase YrrM